MAKAATNKPVFSFTKGKVTEASALTYPENSAKTLTNFDINLDGTVQRRLGVDFETGYVQNFSLPLPSLLASAISVYTWKTVGGRSGLDVMVIQVGWLIKIFKLGFTNLSNKLLAELDVRTVPGIVVEGTALISVKQMQFAAGKGVCFVTEENMNPFYIERNEDTSLYSLNVIDVKRRDFKGVTSYTNYSDTTPLGDDERPTVLTWNHVYNLRNQGWPDLAQYYDTSFGLRDPITTFYSKYLRNVKTESEKKYPSNSDHFRNAQAQNDGSPAWTVKSIVSDIKGHGLAPKGHYIMNAFTRNRGEAAGLESPYDTLIQGESPLKKRPQSVAFYSGRAFYAGIPNSQEGGTVYFSQLLTDFDNVGKCYQKNDPTSEELNALLATDGGVIDISEAGLITKMIPYNRSLIIFAENGIWTLDGGADRGFDAESISVNKISPISCVAPDTAVESDQGILFWSKQGIYVITQENTGTYSVQSLSETTIQTDYLDIPEESRVAAKAMYSREDNKIYWLYSSTSPTDNLANYKYSYDRLLILDLRLGAFCDYHLTRQTGTPVIAGVIPKTVSTEDTNENTVVIGDDTVVIGANTVVISQEVNTYNSANLKLLTLSAAGSGAIDFTFSEFSNTDFTDWETYLGTGLGIDAEAEIITGYEVLQDLSREKQIGYFTTHLNRTEQNFIDDGSGNLVLDFPSSCLVQARWDWTSTSTAGRWSTEFQAYKLNRLVIPSGAEPLDYSFDVITTKNKIRGRGKAVNFRLRTEAGKDLQLLGWDVLYSGGRRV